MKIKKSFLYVCVLSLLLCQWSTAQNVEIQGQAKVTEMTNDDKIDEIVVRKPDGTLATRSAQSLPSSFIDTTRSLNTDFELAKHICDCGTNLPPYLIESLLGAGYSTQDLIKAGVPLTSLSETLTTVTDLDGNEYDVVTIGTQKWLKQNLRVTQYNDGTPIDLQLANNDWIQSLDAKLPAYAYPSGNNINVEQYGLIYSSYSVLPDYNAGKNLCPVGWTVPTYLDLDTLRDYLEPGSSAFNNSAGTYLKSNDGSWTSPNIGANNLTEFDGFPAGARWNSGNYAFFGNRFYLHTKSLNGATAIKYYYMENDETFLKSGATTFLLGGHSIRCVKE